MNAAPRTPSASEPIAARLAEVRALLVAESAHALLVPSADPHLSEYLPARWQGRRHLSGFTGSMGTLVVTRDRAALFADSRYWVQAEAELAGSGIALEKIVSLQSPAHADWLVRTLRAGDTVLADGQVLALAAGETLRATLARGGIALRTEFDPLDRCWPGRPGLPDAPIYAHRPPHATVPRTARLAAVRDAMTRAGASHHFVSTLDDIAWITNLRGADVEYNPVFLAHLLIAATNAASQPAATLFVAPGKIDAALAAGLAADGIALAPYAAAGAALAALPADATVLLDPRRVTVGLRQHVQGARVIEAINPSTLLKSRKSDAELAHIRAAMEQDGVAMCEFYADFEAALAAGHALTELSVDAALSAARARRPGFVGLSFPTIAGFNANGAQPHYRATPAAHAAIAGDGLLLIDSGGQYLGGTTDITRVWPIGTVSAATRRDCTLVLKGMLALSRARFPRGTPGPMLDALARAPLWAEGVDFGHGTGHGVGYFLNVHEGPQSISRAVPEPAMAMEPGMVTSIEPGVYRPGQWGVRIENLVACVPAVTAEGETFAPMLEFETLSLCPIDTRCLARELLREDEVAWLNAYHAMVRERLAPRLSGAPLAWLMARTADMI